jgi:hypothetical protein
MTPAYTAIRVVALEANGERERRTGPVEGRIEGALVVHGPKRLAVRYRIGFDSSTA